MRESGGVCSAGIKPFRVGHTAAKEMMKKMAIKIKLSSKEAQKIAKECIAQSEKYNLPRKKK